MIVLADLDPDVAYPATVPEMSESWLHTRVRIQAYQALGDHFAGRPGCFVGSDFNVYYRPRPQSAFVAPDVFVCFGVDPGPIESAASYRVWDAGAPPSFVLEIASESTRERDLRDKPAIYLEMGVEEYWRLDPTGGDHYTPFLQGDRLAGGAPAPIDVTPDGDGRLLGHSHVLGLDLRAEPRRLRFGDPRTGLWLPDHDDTRERADAEAAARRAAEDRAGAAEAARRNEAAARRAAEAELAALRARLNDRDGDTA